MSHKGPCTITNCSRFPPQHQIAEAEFGIQDLSGLFYTLHIRITRVTLTPHYTNASEIMDNAKRENIAMFPSKEIDSSTVDPDKLADNLARTSLKDPAPVPVSTFEEMNLNPNLLKAISENKNVEKPAFCQQRVIMPCIQGRDVICQAQSEIGKTAVFCIAILQRIDPKNPNCRALVITPTRELAEKITGVFQAIGKLLNVSRVRCCGGTKVKANEAAFTSGRKAQIAVGTLCSVYNLMKKEFSDADAIDIIVIEEADNMIMNSSFRRDMKYIIIGYVSGLTQVIVMSATMPSFALDLNTSSLQSPFEVLVKSDQLTLDWIKQYYVNVGTSDKKVEVLSEILPYLKSASGIVFCNTRKRAEELNKKMETRGHVISDMVGTMDQLTANQTLRNFRSGAIPFLIATDILGLGIDVDHVRLVINYEICEKHCIDQYIHRVERAGRYGKMGIAITFVTEMELPNLQRIEEFFHTSILPMPANIGDLLDARVPGSK